jgi:collagenase-like PrtC family protease
MAVTGDACSLTLGPVLFNWPAERWRDFYFRIADEAPVSAVYVGEVVCSKRAPLFEPFLDAVIGRLRSAGKTVMISTLAEVASVKDRALVESMCTPGELVAEANDASALFHLKGRPHHAGPLLNVYNGQALRFLAANGAGNFCLPPELPASSVRELCNAARECGATVEVMVFGRLPLALSARCYHARAHGRTKDSCRFVCEEDLDGFELRTLENQPFLAINGIQTMSYEYLNLVHALGSLQESGVSRFRLSPHTCDMVAAVTLFRNVLDGHTAPDEAAAGLAALVPDAIFCDGFLEARPGYEWSRAPR